MTASTRPGGSAIELSGSARAAADGSKRPMLAPKAAASTELQRLVAGINPLLGAANLLLALVAKLRATTTHADPASLRHKLLAHVAQFEAEAKAGGVPRPKIVAARYLLCTFIDETVMGTPWAADGVWAARTLLQEFHEESWGGEKAFKLLERMGEDVAANADLLELFYVCLALGFEGRFRGKPNGRAQLDAITARLLQSIRPQGNLQGARTLSLRWTGASIPNRALRTVPLWVAMTVGATAIVGATLAFNARLNDQAAPELRRILALPATLRSDLLDRSRVAARPRLAPMLQEQIAAGDLAVHDEALRSVIVLPADTLFIAGTARLDQRRDALLDRIALALAALPGQIAVVGHTDDRPTRSVQFPSNWHLAFERASAVVQALALRGARPESLRAEGRAEAQPLAGNDTAEGRARNRRIEIELLLPRPEG